MSRPQRDAYSAARRLQAELARLAARRERAIQKANADFQLELIQAVAGAAASSLKLVVAVLREDVGQLHLSRALQTVIDAGPQVANDSDASERKTEPPSFVLRPPPDPPTLDGNESWGMPANARVLSPAEPAPTGYRYPEPGEPALELPDGTVVFDESAGAQA